MKKIKPLIPFWILLIFIFYGLSCFIAWDYNPGNWPHGGRLISVFAMVCLPALIIAILTIEDDLK